MDANRRRFARRAWIGMAVVACQNAEEALAAQVWVGANSARIQSLLNADVSAFNQMGFLLAVLGATLVPLALVTFAQHAPPRSRAAYSLLVLFGAFGFNALVPHLAVAIVFRAYTPGAATAALLVLPFNAWFALAGVRDKAFTWAGTLKVLLASLVLYGALAALALRLGDWI